MGLNRTIEKLMAPLARRVKLMIGRCVIDLVDDTQLEQVIQAKLLDGEIRTLERYQQYGFTSVPHQRAEGICAFIGGNRDHGIVIATGDRRYRLSGLADGEVALYDDQGQKIHLKRGKEIEISGCDTLTASVGQQATVTCPLVNVVASTRVNMTTPLLQVSGNITAGGNITDLSSSGGRSMADMRSTYNGHTHPENGDGGGTTSAPNQSM